MQKCSEICRFCLKDLKNETRTYEIREDIRNDYKSLTKQQLMIKCSSLPNKICDFCNTFLQSINSFREQVIKNQQLLEDEIKNDLTVDENEGVISPQPIPVPLPKIKRIRTRRKAGERAETSVIAIRDLIASEAQNDVQEGTQESEGTVPKPPQEQDRISGNTCNKLLPSVKDLEIHQKTGKRLQCDWCEKAFCSKSKSTKHKQANKKSPYPKCHKIQKTYQSVFNDFAELE